MAKKRQPQKTKGFNPPSKKTPQKAQDPISYEDKNFIWRVSNNYIDYDNPKIGWGKVDILDFLKKIVQSLHTYEGFQWKQVRCRDHCHSWELNEIPSEFYRRLQELNIDVDRIFQISLGSKSRIFGHIDRQIFYLIWYDPDHEFWPMDK